MGIFSEWLIYSHHGTLTHSSCNSFLQYQLDKNILEIIRYELFVRTISEWNPKSVAVWDIALKTVKKRQTLQIKQKFYIKTYILSCCRASRHEKKPRYGRLNFLKNFSVRKKFHIFAFFKLKMASYRKANNFIGSKWHFRSC